jgi:hypothetical protein
MRLFGILLTFFCLVAGGAYVYFGAQDYKGRQETNARVLRHLILLQGLPAEGADFSPEDETPFEVRLTTGESSRTVSKKLVENYFKDNAAAPPATDTATAPAVPLGGTEAVLNQVAELKRVRALLKAELEKVKDAPAQKIALLVRSDPAGAGGATGAGWLLLHAETMNERIEYQDWAAPTKIEAVDEKTKGQERAKTPSEVADDAERLVHALDRKFYRVAPKLYESADAALSPAKWAALQGQPEGVAQLPVSTDDADRRARLAHLLVHLDRDSAWQRRVAVVVGLRRYVAAVATQASRFREMRDQVDLPVAADQATFQRGQDALISEALIQSARARTTAEARNKAESQLVSAKAAVEQRQTQIDDLEASLKKVRAEVDQLLVRQTAVEADLFEIQREVSLTLEEVYRLEALLVEAERERYGLSPRP